MSPHQLDRDIGFLQYLMQSLSSYVLLMQNCIVVESRSNSYIIHSVLSEALFSEEHHINAHQHPFGEQFLFIFLSGVP